MATLEELTEKIARAAQGAQLDRSIKLDLKGEGVIRLAGGAVSNDDGPADLTVTVSVRDLMAMGRRELDPMPEALKTDATLVRGCSAKVWVYPVIEDGRLHFLADSNAAITKGIVALVLSAVQDKPAAEVARTDIAAALEPFDLRNQLSSNRTQGVPNMIALVRETAARFASEAH